MSVPPKHRQQLARVLGVAGAALLALLVLAGCSSVPDQLGAAVDQGIASTASSQLAVKFADAGKALPGYADTVLSDSLTELDKTVDSATEITASSSSDAQHRADVLDALRHATDAVLGAREDVAAGRDLGDATRELKAASAALKDLAKELS